MDRNDDVRRGGGIILARFVLVVVALLLVIVMIFGFRIRFGVDERCINFLGVLAKSTLNVIDCSSLFLLL